MNPLAQKKSPPGNNENTNVYIATIPKFVTTLMIEELCTPFGDMKRFTIRSNKSGNGNYAFVEYVRQEQATLAINSLNGIHKWGVRLNVSLARGRRKSDPSLPPTNIFIKGIPTSWRPHDVHVLFEKYGMITSTRCLGNGRAFVRFSDPRDAEMAVRGMNMTSVGPNEDVIHVKYAIRTKKSKRHQNLQEESEVNNSHQHDIGHVGTSPSKYNTNWEQWSPSQLDLSQGTPKLLNWQVCTSPVSGVYRSPMPGVFISASTSPCSNIYDWESVSSGSDKSSPKFLPGVVIDPMNKVEPIQPPAEDAKKWFDSSDAESQKMGVWLLQVVGKVRPFFASHITNIFMQIRAEKPEEFKHLISDRNKLMKQIQLTDDMLHKCAEKNRKKEGPFTGNDVPVCTEFSHLGLNDPTFYGMSPTMSPTTDGNNGVATHGLSSLVPVDHDDLYSHPPTPDEEICLPGHGKFAPAVNYGNEGNQVSGVTENDNIAVLGQLEGITIVNNIDINEVKAVE